VQTVITLCPHNEHIILITTEGRLCYKGSVLCRDSLSNLHQINGEQPLIVLRDLLKVSDKISNP
jgi:hypothetical protein